MRAFIFSIVFIVALTKVSFGQVSESVSLTTKTELKKMILYGSDTCHYCLDTKAYLRERKIDFIYFDVEI